MNWVQSFWKYQIFSSDSFLLKNHKGLGVVEWVEWEVDILLPSKRRFPTLLCNLHLFCIAFGSDERKEWGSEVWWTRNEKQHDPSNCFWKLNWKSSQISLHWKCANEIGVSHKRFTKGYRAKCELCVDDLLSLCLDSKGGSVLRRLMIVYGFYWTWN